MQKEALARPGVRWGGRGLPGPRFWIGGFYADSAISQAARLLSIQVPALLLLLPVGLVRPIQRGDLGDGCARDQALAYSGVTTE